jgi:tight adherence protein B
VLTWCAFAALLILSTYCFRLSALHRSRSRAAGRLQRLSGDSGDDAHTSGGHPVKSSSNRVLEGLRIKGLRDSLEGAGLESSWKKYAAIWLLAAALLPAGAALAAGSLVAVPPVLLLVLLSPRLALSALERRRRRRASLQAERLSADVALFLRCGVPVEAAIDLASRDATPPLRQAIERFESQAGLGVGLNGAALHELATALADPDFELMAHAVTTSRETGSDIRVIMAGVGDALRERASIRRELDSQTVQSRLSGRIVAGLPFLFLGLTCLVSKGTIPALFGTAPGLLIFSAAAALDLLGFLWTRRILNIKI